MNSKLEFSSYLFENQNELCLRLGAQHPRQVLFIPPLFDELNRMRRVLIDAMRLLNERAIGTALPDLPGTNESLIDIQICTIHGWQQAMASCRQTVNNLSCTASFRGGALVDDIESPKHWQLSPVSGARILRAMVRTKVASNAEDGNIITTTDIEARAGKEAVNLAGHSLGSKLFKGLQAAGPVSHSNLRLCRLEGDNKDAHAYLKGSPIWLRAEPDSDMLLSRAIADDIAAWINS